MNNRLTFWLIHFFCSKNFGCTDIYSKKMSSPVSFVLLITYCAMKGTFVLKIHFTFTLFKKTAEVGVFSIKNGGIASVKAIST